MITGVMGFCNDKQYADFLRMCPGFESLLRNNGIILAKYWFESLARLPVGSDHDMLTVAIASCAAVMPR